MNKKLFVCVVIIGFVFLLVFSFMTALSRTAKCEAARQKNTLRNELIVTMRQVVPQYILTHPEINDENFSSFTENIYYQKKIIILNNLSVWKSHLNGVLQNDNDLIAVSIEYEQKMMGYRFSGEFEDHIRINETDL